MKIFISYRHSPRVAADANLIRDRLSRHFGVGSVFLDSDALKGGDEFPAVLEERLAACKVVLVLIDPHWIQSAPRLQEPGDWVLRELQIALRRRADDGIRVIPLLLQGASMPGPDLLPPSLAAVAGLHAISLRGDTLDDDLATLVQRLRGWTPEKLMLWLQARRSAALAVAFGTLLLLCALLIALADALTLDTRLEAMTLGWAEMIQDPQPNDRLVIVGIDRETVQRLNKPFDKSWRAEHASLIRKLADGGASVVAFDIYLSGTSPHDQALADAVDAARVKGTSVVFGIARDGAEPALPASASEQGLLCIGTELEWARLAPLALRRPAADASTGVSALPLLPGAAVRRWEYEASLGLRAVLPQASIQEVDFENRRIRLEQPGQGLRLWLAFSRADLLERKQDCAGLKPGDQIAQRLVRFTSLERLREPARRLRYEDLCCAGAGPAAAAGVRGKIVLVGSELTSGEVFTVMRGLGTEERFGYELHADLINTLLDGVDLRALGALPQFLLMLAMGGLGMLARFWPLLWPRWRSRAVLLAVPLAYLSFGVVLCAVGNLLLNVAYHLAAFFFAFWISGLLLRRRGLLGHEMP